MIKSRTDSLNQTYRLSKFCKEIVFLKMLIDIDTQNSSLNYLCK